MSHLKFLVMYIWTTQITVYLWMTPTFWKLNPNSMSLGSRKPYISGSHIHPCTKMGEDTIYQVCGPIFSMRGPRDQVLGPLTAKQSL